MKAGKKSGFTIVEVSILFVIFLIVAFLVAPLSLDETMQAKNISRWKSVQSDFNNIAYAINTINNSDNVYKDAFNSVIAGEIKDKIASYKISYMNGYQPSQNDNYSFSEYSLTNSGAVIAYKFFDDSDGVKPLGYMMYDINGPVGPNVWGKDIFGLDIYLDRFEPFCKNDALEMQQNDCNKGGTGICCSNYYLLGGSID